MPEGERPGDTVTSVDVARQLAPGTLLAERYRIVALVGLGGMGLVYKAHDEELHVDVAVKVLRPDLGQDPEWIERFRRELVLAREVTHPHVVRIHDIGQSGELRFLTMRFVEGRSLAQLLRDEGALPLARALAIVTQIADALRHAHAAGIVHRDLKPGNILVEADDTAYIADFGVARALDGAAMTSAGTIVGTLDYLAPEQIDGAPADARSDLYALGVVFYEMLTARLPFAATSRAEALAQRLAGRTRRLADSGTAVPAWVERVVARCLARHPARRYASAAELLGDLARGAAAPARGRRARTALALLTAAVLGSGALFLSLRARAPRAPDAAPAPAEPQRGVAVLPLADETGDATLAWTSAGSADMLATQLSASAELRVLDTPRVLRSVADLGLDGGRYDEAALRRLAELFAVDRLVTGSVRRAGAALRIDVRLVAFSPAGGVTSRPLQAQSVDVEGLFRALDTLAAELRAALGAPVPAATDPGVTSLDAARAYREGLDRLLAGDASAAASAFERALGAEPNYAEALERLAETYQALGYRERALQAAERAAQALGARETRLAYRVRARVALLEGHPAAAAASYGELVRRYPNDAAALLDLAAAQSAQGEAAQAAATLERAARLDGADPRIFFLLGKSAIQAGDARDAVTGSLLKALTLYARLRNEAGQGDALNALGVGLHELGDYAQALEKYGAAAALRRKLGDRRGLATSLKNRGRVLVAMGRFTEAQPDLRAARALYEQLDDPDGSAGVLDDLGLLHEGRGEFRQAREAYQEALRLRRSLGDEQALAQSYDNVGYAFFLAGEYDSALVYWQQALARRRSLDDKAGLALSTQNLGFLQLAQGRWSAATQSFVTALDLARALDLKNAAAVSHGNLGVLAHHEGRFGAALEALERALVILKELDDRRGLTEFTLKQAAVRLELRQLDAAKAQLDAAQAWLAHTDNKEQAADQRLLLAEWHLARGEDDAARRALAAAVEQARASHGRAALLRARLAQAAVQDDAAALAELNVQADALGDALLGVRAAEAVARAELRRGRLPPAEQAARRALRSATRCGYGARLYRLDLLLGGILERRGDEAGALRQYREGRARARRLRQGLTGELRAAFDALDDVRALEARAGGVVGTP